MSKIYGYARCSLAEEKGQDLNRQVRELKAAGAEEIFLEYEHGDSKIKAQQQTMFENSKWIWTSKEYGENDYAEFCQKINYDGGKVNVKFSVSGEL